MNACAKNFAAVFDKVGRDALAKDPGKIVAYATDCVVGAEGRRSLKVLKYLVDGPSEAALLWEVVSSEDEAEALEGATRLAESGYAQASAIVPLLGEIREGFHGKPQPLFASPPDPSPDPAVAVKVDAGSCTLELSGGSATVIGFNYRKKKVAIPESVDHGGRRHPVTAIDPGVFSGSKGLMAVKVPGTVTEIPEGAFAGCTALQEVILQPGTVRIGARAFQGCPRLASVTFPKTGNLEVGSRAFAGCPLLGDRPGPGAKVAKDAFDSPAVTGVIQVKDLKYELDRTALTAKVVGYHGQGGVVGMPDSVDYNGQKYAVTQLAGNVFAGNGSIAMVILSGNLEAVPDGAFEDCTGLKTVRGKKSVKRIGFRAFSGCSSLTTASGFAGLVSVASDAFEDCWDLREIPEPASKSRSRPHSSEFEYSFDDAARRATITKYIGSGGDVIMPESVDRSGTKYLVNNVESALFKGNPNITSVKIPSLVTVIPGDCFRGCRALREVTGHSSVVLIRGGAFVGCPSLKSLKGFRGLRRIEEDAFDMDDYRPLFDCTVPDPVIKPKPGPDPGPGPGPGPGPVIRMPREPLPRIIPIAGILAMVIATAVLMYFGMLPNSDLAIVALVFYVPTIIALVLGAVLKSRAVVGVMSSIGLFFCMTCFIVDGHHYWLMGTAVSATVVGATISYLILDGSHMREQAVVGIAMIVAGIAAVIYTFPYMAPDTLNHYAFAWFIVPPIAAAIFSYMDMGDFEEAAIISIIGVVANVILSVVMNDWLWMFMPSAVIAAGCCTLFCIDA